MKFLLACIVAANLVVFISCKTKPTKKFTKIHYALFDVNSYRTPQVDTPFIWLYTEIEANGNIHIYNHFDLKEQIVNKLTRLSPLEIDSINKLLLNASELKMLVNEYSLKSKDEFFAGSYDYFVVHYQDGQKDTLCTIQPFMNEAFIKVQEMLENKYYQEASVSSSDSLKPSSTFIKALTEKYLANKLLPKIENPPPFIRE